MKIQKRTLNGLCLEVYKLSAGYSFGINGSRYQSFGYTYRSIVVYIGRYCSFIQWRLS